MVKMHQERKQKIFHLSPPLVIFSSFFLVIFVGSLLLSLPIAAEPGQTTRYLDALFTATSATCVTGLVVFDTATHWSSFGEVVILLLIQIGGLGLITLATFFTALLGRKQGLQRMILARESINHFDYRESVALIRQVIKVVFIIELIGATILTWAFLPRYGIKALSMGIFHSVSAFCNAGFDIVGDNLSLTSYSDNPVVLLTVCTLIIVGGLGFIVWKDVWQYKKTKKLQVHTKIVLIMTGVLLVLGTVVVWLLEFTNPNTLGDKGFLSQANNAFFMSVNTRTAGFAALDLGKTHETTKVFQTVLMFIGGASGSTAGGIKVNTLGILVLAVISVLYSKEDILVFKRKIPNSTAMKAFAVTSISLLLVFFITFIISILQPEFSLIDVLFEATSAFGTVGLSTGLTPKLSDVSRFLIILNMFIGRIGPVTFALSLSLASKKHAEVIYPEAKIAVG